MSFVELNSNFFSFFFSVWRLFYLNWRSLLGEIGDSFCSNGSKKFVIENWRPCDEFCFLFTIWVCEFGDPCKANIYKLLDIEYYFLLTI